MPVEMEFCLLGPLVVRRDGAAVPIPRGKQRALLAALLLQAGRPVSAGRLIELLWEGAPPPSAKAGLQNYVRRLRRALGDQRHDRIATCPGGYLINVGVGELDITRLETGMAAARTAARQESWQQAAGQAVAAAALWRGEPLSGVDVPLLVLQEAPRLTELFLQAREVRIEADLELARHTDVVVELQGLIAAHPLREHLRALLIRALYRCGRRAEALAAYQEARALLVEELGSEPGPELQALHQQVLTDDPALAAPAPPPTGERSRTPTLEVPRHLPAAVGSFTGRDGELAALTRLVGRASRGTPPTVVISAIGGMAGVGKTTLAIQWAHQIAGQFPDGQLYVNLRAYDPALPPMPAEEAVRLFLDAFQIPAGRIPASAQAQAGLYRSVLADKKVLIVADNAADAAQVRPLLPASAGCLVIVTSRSTLAGLVAVDGAIPLSLDVLTSAEARDLLARILGAGRLAAEPEAAAQLIQACGRLPLALAITAARAATRPQLPLATVAAELASAADRLDALQAAGDVLASVRAALASSYQQLSGGAARMLRLLGVHPGPDISAPAAASLASLPGPQAAAQLAELADASLISRGAASRYALHDLVRLYAAEQAQRPAAAAEREAATGRMLDHYLHTGHAAARLLHPGRQPITVGPPSPGTAPEHLADDRAAMSWFQAEHRVLIAAVGHAFTAGQDPRAWTIAWTLQDYFYYRGHWHEQLAVQTTALAAAVRLGDSILQARSHHYLARAAVQLRRYDDADTHYRHALDLYRQLGDPAWQAKVHLGLAVMLDRPGQHAQAVGHARQALELSTAVGDEVGQANALNNLGWLHGQLGDYEQALPHCQQALILSRVAGDRQIEGDTLDSLGCAHHHLGQHAEAIACYQQALDIGRELNYRYLQAAALSHLGDTHQATGDLQAALTAWREALSILDDLQHPDAIHVRAKLGAAEAGHTAASAAKRGR
jgi:DNA-binding SARP family transcriptional activator